MGNAHIRITWVPPGAGLGLSVCPAAAHGSQFSQALALRHDKSLWFWLHSSYLRYRSSCLHTHTHANTNRSLLSYLPARLAWYMIVNIHCHMLLQNTHRLWSLLPYLPLTLLPLQLLHSDPIHPWMLNRVCLPEEMLETTFNQEPGQTVLIRCRAWPDDPTDQLPVCT